MGREGALPLKTESGELNRPLVIKEKLAKAAETNDKEFAK